MQTEWQAYEKLLYTVLSPGPIQTQEGSQESLNLNLCQACGMGCCVCGTNADCIYDIGIKKNLRTSLVR
jgi:hypothetical protein